MWAPLASSLPSCSCAQHLVGQRTLYREAIRENCELSCAKLWCFTLVSTEFFIILDPWLHTMLAPTTCSSAMAIMTALATNATQPVQGLCFRSRLVASTPEVLDNLATKDVHMLLGAIWKSEKISSTLRFQMTSYILHICIYVWYLCSSHQWKFGYTMLQYGQYLGFRLVCLEFCVSDLKEKNHSIRESQENTPTHSN